MAITACKEGDEPCRALETCVRCYAQACASARAATEATAPLTTTLGLLDILWHERLAADHELRLRFEVAYARAVARGPGG